MLWSDILVLISQKWPDDGCKINKNGFAIIPEEKSHTVFGNKTASWQSEFYNAQQMGIKVEFNIEIHKADYAGEEFAEFERKQYKILRVEESKNGEYITLILSDLWEKGDGDGYN